jgi:hypothetical protein
MIIADIEDIRLALNMDDAAGEIVGFFNTGFYDDELAGQIASRIQQERRREVKMSSVPS